MATDKLDALLIAEKRKTLLGALDGSGAGNLSHGKGIRSQDREVAIDVAALPWVEGFVVR